MEEEPLYRLNISGYDLESSTIEDSFTGNRHPHNHNGMAFSTSDNDNDLNPGNCAKRYLGAWWYESCYSSSLNGFNYNDGSLPESPAFDGKGIIWANTDNVPDHDAYFSWPKASMKMRRRL